MTDRKQAFLNWWPFPIIRNYKTDAALTDLFYLFARQPDLSVIELSEHYTTVSCSLGTMTFWSANRYYAWADSGEWTTPAGRKIRWKDAMPSRGAVRAMSRLTGKWNAPDKMDALRAALQSLGEPT